MTVSGVHWQVQLTYRNSVLHHGVVRCISLRNIHVETDSSLRGDASFGAYGTSSGNTQTHYLEFTYRQPRHELQYRIRD